VGDPTIHLLKKGISGTLKSCLGVPARLQKRAASSAGVVVPDDTAASTRLTAHATRALLCLTDTRTGRNAHAPYLASAGLRRPSAKRKRHLCLRRRIDAENVSCCSAKAPLRLPAARRTEALCGTTGGSLPSLARRRNDHALFLICASTCCCGCVGGITYLGCHLVIFIPSITGFLSIFYLRRKYFRGLSPIIYLVATLWLSIVMKSLLVECHRAWVHKITLPPADHTTTSPESMLKRKHYTFYMAL